MTHSNRRLTVLALLAGLLSAGARSGTLEEDIATIQHDWARAYYQVSEDEKEDVFNDLIYKGERLIERHPGKAEPLIWHAIVLSSAAKFSGGLGALGKCKKARKELEAAARIDPNAMDGSIYTSLGSLYANVPGWPIGFGDEDKADELLRKALAINPDGIDPNFFYGQLKAEQDDEAAARQYYEKALAAPPRPGREDADAGRREEIRTAMAELSG